MRTWDGSGASYFLPVRGTWERGEHGNWAGAGSPLRQFLEGHGLRSLDTRATMPFEWTTALDIFASEPDWPTAGANLRGYLVPPLAPSAAWPGRETRLLTHSHGLQVALHAAAAGLKVDVLVDVAGPVRRDMMPVARLARVNIRRWVHVFSDFTDKWQWLGELGDGHLGIVREHPLADRNVKLAGMGHTGVLNDPVYFGNWITRGLMAELKGTVTNGSFR